MEDGAAGADAPNKDKAATTTGELGEKIKKIEMKPPPPPGTTVGLLAKNAALLPSSIVRVKQLDSAAPKPVLSTGSSGSATGNPRNKTALAPGHSLMDWIRLGASGVDLTGVGGRLLTVTPAELAKHNKPDDAWIAIRGQVFNITRYLSFHPGGIPELMKGAGKDATRLFDDVHAWVNYQSILQKCLVGRLERSVNLELYFGSDEAKPDKSAKSEGRAKGPGSAGLKTDWRQTTGTVSLLYTTLPDDTGGECQLRRLTESELDLTVWLEKSGRAARHVVKLAGDVQWPPSWKSTSQASETEIVFKKKERGIWKTCGSLRASDEAADPAERAYTEYEVLENTPLCEVVHLLVLRSRDYMQIVPPGRHVEVKMDVMGTEVSRPYTPVPSWLHPSEAVDCSDERLCLMVKRYEDGALSPRLSQLRPGDGLRLSGALGRFRAEAFDRYDRLHMLAAGTGLTPMLGLVKRALARRSPPSINLINFNRDERSIFYRQQLELVAEERGLKVTHVLSEAGGTWSGRTGGATEQLLNELMGERSARACVFTCGPPGFIKLAAQSLRSLGWEPSQMHEFDG